MASEQRSRKTAAVMIDAGAGGRTRGGRRARVRERPPEDVGEVRMASPEEVLAALEGLDLQRPWPEVAPSVVPVLPRWRPFLGGSEEPLLHTWPPGITGTFGIDLGPAFVYLGDWALRQWGIAQEELAERALDNVRRWAATREHALLPETFAGHLTRALQTGDEWASNLLLLPDELVRAFGPEPCLLIAPMRDILIAMPIAAEVELAAWLRDELAQIDPNGLDLPVFALVDGRLSIASGEPGGPAPGGGSARH